MPSFNQEDLQRATAQHEAYMTNCLTNATELATTYRQQSNNKRATSRQQQVCEFCCAVRAEYTLFGQYNYCYECAASLLVFMLMPQHAHIMRDHDTDMMAAIGNAERMEREAAGNVFSGPSSPISEGLNSSNGQSGWKCSHCTLENSAFNTTCEVCGMSKPQLFCPLCALDCLTHPNCRVARQPHDLWSCEHCGQQNLKDAVECRACMTRRVWFCKACSLENTYSSHSCAVCGGTEKLSSLKSMIARNHLESMGLSAAEAELERQTSTAVAEGQDRLAVRVKNAGLNPVKIDDDGNCLFRALGFQLFRDDSLHLLIRRMIVEYIQANSDDYAPFIGSEEFPKYLADMSNDRHWGDEPCVRAAAKVFNCTIHMITSDAERWHLKYKIYGGVDPAPGRHLFMAHINPVHFYTFTLPKDVILPSFDPDATCAKLAPTVQPLPDPIVTSVTPATPVASPSPKRENSFEGSVNSLNLSLSGSSRNPSFRLRHQNDTTNGVNWVPWQSIPQLKHAIVVVIRVGTSPLHVALPNRATSSGPVAVLDRTATRFYLHPSGWIIKHGKSEKQPVFFLQDVVSGGFLCPTDPMGGGRLRSARVHLQPLDYAQLSRFRLTIENKTDFVFTGKQSTRYWTFVTQSGGAAYNTSTAGGADSLILTEDKVAGCQLRLVHLFSGRKERFCRFCKTWYDAGGTAAPPPLSNSRPGTVTEVCLHQNHADPASVLLAQHAATKKAEQQR